MESFREYVLQEKMKLREHGKVMKRIKLDLPEIKIDENNDEENDIIKCSATGKKIEGLNNEIRRYFLYQLQTTLFKRFSSQAKKHDEVENMKKIACKMEYSAFCRGETLSNYKCLIFQKMAELKKGLLEQVLANLIDQKIESAVNEMFLFYPEEDNVTNIEEPNKNEDEAQLHVNIANKKENLSDEQSESRQTYEQEFSDVIIKAEINSINIFDTQSSVYENELIENFTGLENDLLNEGPKIKIVTAENEKCALNTNDSPFVPIKSFDKIKTTNESCETLETEYTSESWSNSSNKVIQSEDNSLNISDIEKDAFKDELTKYFANDNSDLMDLETKIENNISLKKYLDGSSQDTLFFSAESFNSDINTEDDCIIVEVINKNNPDESCENSTKEENSLSNDVPEMEPVVHQESIEKSLNNSSLEILDSSSESDVIFIEELNCFKDIEWDVILGPLKIKYVTMPDYVTNSQECTNKYLSDEKEEDSFLFIEQ